VGISIAQNPAAAVNIDYRRQDIDCAGRANDPYRHRSGWADREGGILNLGAWLANRHRLYVHQDGPRIGRRAPVMSAVPFGSVVFMELLLGSVRMA